MLYMKTATVREVQHHFKRLLSRVQQGEEVQVLYRKKLVARLVPPNPVAPIVSPNFLERAKRIWGESPSGLALSDLIARDREEH
jgi:antitoxin (DNA-binding transcriptional repressor) of toxin-antitoxin stability system